MAFVWPGLYLSHVLSLESCSRTPDGQCQLAMFTVTHDTEGREGLLFARAYGTASRCRSIIAPAVEENVMMMKASEGSSIKQMRIQ